MDDTNEMTLDPNSATQQNNDTIKARSRDNSRSNKARSRHPSMNDDNDTLRELSHCQPDVRPKIRSLSETEAALKHRPRPRYCELCLVHLSHATPDHISIIIILPT